MAGRLHFDARLRDMISKAKSSRNKPDWISEDTWQSMLEYWSTDEAKKKRKTASANRLSDGDGNKKKVLSLLMLHILRETHRKVDSTYVDEKTKAFDEEIQRQLDEIEISRNSSGPSADDSTNFTGLTRLDEDEIYYKHLKMEGYLVLEDSVHASKVKTQQLMLSVESLLNAKS
ncbi:unnamed protein product [Arabidopsis thaliana]|uniref:(thale cress) hypothetical protein n=1 Tax=Arabidopsis thaliana TaxID=3702 RepID=A0A7G2ES16_ARATH|nr:unnamed protein product [Arabidopsis thaliana]